MAVNDSMLDEYVRCGARHPDAPPSLASLAADLDGLVVGAIKAKIEGPNGHLYPVDIDRLRKARELVETLLTPQAGAMDDPRIEVFRQRVLAAGFEALAEKLTADLQDLKAEMKRLGHEAEPCRGCGEALNPANSSMADGCPCNSARGVNHGIVSVPTCTCIECDPDQTGSSRQRKSEENPLRKCPLCGPNKDCATPWNGDC